MLAGSSARNGSSGPSIALAARPAARAACKHLQPRLDARRAGLPQRRQPPVEGGERYADADRPAGKQVEIAPHQRALRQQAQPKAALQEQLAAAAREPVLRLDRLPAVGMRC